VGAQLKKIESLTLQTNDFGSEKYVCYCKLPCRMEEKHLQEFQKIKRVNRIKMKSHFDGGSSVRTSKLVSRPQVDYLLSCLTQMQFDSRLPAMVFFLL
jgi:hypothetical protein